MLLLLNKRRFSLNSFYRLKTETLDNLARSLRDEFKSLDEETKALDEYKSELELLQAEKLKHVEILRQIHSDINMV